MWVLLVTLTTLFTQSFSAHDFYWNSSNPVFEPFEGAIDSPGFHEIVAKPDDVIRFHCPKRKMKEFSIIYKVSHDDFMHCSLSPTAVKVGACDGHPHTISHMLKRDDEGESVYFISTSTGTASGMNSRRLGLCLEKNMRLAVSLGPPEMQVLHEIVGDLELDAQRLSNEHLYLAEENGDLYWKKNVHPDIEGDLEVEIRNTRLRFDKTKQMEPIPIDDEFVNRLEEYKKRHQMDVQFPPDVLVFAELPDAAGGIGSWLLPVLLSLYILL